MLNTMKFLVALLCQEKVWNFSLENELIFMILNFLNKSENFISIPNIVEQRNRS